MLPAVKRQICKNEEENFRNPVLNLGISQIDLSLRYRVFEVKCDLCIAGFQKEAVDMVAL